MKLRAGIAVAVACAAVLAVVLVARDGGEDDPSPGPAATPVAGAGPAEGEGPFRVARSLLGLDGVAFDPAPDPRVIVRGPHHAIAYVEEGESVALLSAPGGERVATLGDTTEFGSRRGLWVKEVRDGWLGVPSPEVPNGALGWVRNDPERLTLYFTRFEVRADISSRVMELRYGDRVIDRFPVSVGGAGSPTPPGDYSITDGLAGPGNGPYYGCCILALTGHQPSLPANWIGGDRIAIHGSPSQIGVANSAGCLRASDFDMVSLFARVPLGTPVFIRA